MRNPARGAFKGLKQGPGPPRVKLKQGPKRGPMGGGR